MGNLIERKSELGFSKLIGSEGVLATVARSGLVLGIPNGDASSKDGAPLTASPETHSQTVRLLLVAAGLPADQSAAVNAHASMREGGATGGPGSEVPIFAGYTSV